MVDQQLSNKISWAPHVLPDVKISDTNSTEGNAEKNHCFQLIGLNPKKNTYFMETSSDDSLCIEEEGENTEENIGQIPTNCHYTDGKLKQCAKRLVWSV